MRIGTVVIVLIITVHLLRAQPAGQSIPGRIVQAKIVLQKAVNTASQELFTQAEERLAPAQQNAQFASLADYYLAYSAYRRATLLLQVDKEKADVYLDTAVARLGRIIERDDAFVEAYPLLSGCYGLKMSITPIKAILLGPKSGTIISRAKKLAPSNPRVALQAAIATYNTPAMFGGGKEKGLAEMRSAAELFDRWVPSDSLQPDWGKDEVWAWIGIASMDQKELIQAKRAFDRALEINPENGWVKYVLLPRLEAAAK